jgi:tRNA nucleotidyltransferase (CCA-adding enzyme)
MKIALFQQIDTHIMQDKKPSIFMDNLLETDKLQQYPFTMLSDFVRIEQSPQHHPEGNVWVHTMMVLDMAAQLKEKSRNPRVFMWSALLHDLGKVPATKVRKGKITAYDHDKMGVELAVNFLKEFNEDPEFISKVASMVRWHMQILFVVKDLPFARLEEMIKEAPVDEIALLGYCDRMGRGEVTKEREDREKENIRIFLEKSRKFETKG